MIPLTYTARIYISQPREATYKLQPYEIQCISKKQIVTFAELEKNASLSRCNRIAFVREKPLNVVQSPGAWVFIFFLCLLLLTASGRLASLDAGQQLKAAILLSKTGHLGLQYVPPGVDPAYEWVKGQNGAWYECHDIGNIILMLPSALIGDITSRRSLSDMLSDPPIISCVCVSISYAALAAIACFFLFRTFSLKLRHREAFFLTSTFVAGTFFWAYTKAAWDVLGACCFVSMLLYTSALLLEGRAVTKSLLWSSAFLAAAGSFRYSLLPFLAFGLLLVTIAARKFISRRDAVLAGLVFATLMTPTMIYNWMRMGSIFIPATTAKNIGYVGGAGTADLSGSLGDGLWGLVISPNKGLLAFAPILILCVLQPVVWRSLDRTFKRLILAYLPTALLYILVLSKIRGWGSFGWGPRYLLPILPILFFSAGTVLVMAWGTKYKTFVVCLLLLSGAVAIPPALVNWHLVLTSFPHALESRATLPYQQMGAWDAVEKGILGEALPASANALQDPVRRLSTRFPDCWTVYLIRAAGRAEFVGIVLTLFLLGGTAVGFWRNCRDR